MAVVCMWIGTLRMRKLTRQSSHDGFEGDQSRFSDDMHLRSRLPFCSQCACPSWTKAWRACNANKWRLSRRHTAPVHILLSNPEADFTELR